jgi:hypothetical protein
VDARVSSIATSRSGGGRPGHLRDSLVREIEVQSEVYMETLGDSNLIVIPGSEIWCRSRATNS